MCDPIWKGSRDREIAAEQVLLINLDDVEDGIKELERAARLGLAGAMITEYPLEHRRYDQPEYEPFWAAAEGLDLPLSLHRPRDVRAGSAGPAKRRCATRAVARRRRSTRRCRCAI
jgi:predicted TIM-barrel fold metal-dependent hydrolase